MIMKKQGFLYGSAVLAASAVIVKVLGALFRIPLANMLGGTGMGYFSAAYSVFMPVYAVSVTGLPAAAAKCTADHAARGDEAGAEQVKRASLRLYGLVGITAMLVIMAAAVPFCRLSGMDMYALPAIAMIAPSVLAGCLVSVYRGYFEGRRNMLPTAVSQVIEGAVKLILGLSLCGGCMYMAGVHPDKFLRITGCEGRGITAEQAAVPFGAAAAALGITLSSFAGLIYMIIADRKKGRVSAESSGKSGEILSELLSVALPASVGALIVNLTSTIDLVTVIGSLKRTVSSYPELFRNLTSMGISREQLPNFIYGSFTGLAVTVFNLVPAVTNMFGKSMLPAAAAAKSAGDASRLSECSWGVMLASALVSVPAGIGIAFMGEDILNFLFAGCNAEISVCSASMIYLGLAVPFVSMSSAGAAVLQAAGRADIPVKLMAAGVVIKLTGNILLTAVPSLNVTGAAISTLLCYIFIFIMTVIYMRKYAELKKSCMTAIITKTWAAGMLCGAGAFTMSNVLSGQLDGRLCTLLSCFWGGIIYIIVTYFSGIITKKSLKMLIS